MTKSIKTCTHNSEIVDGECLDCKTWNKISKNFKPQFDKKTKVSTITIKNEVFKQFKKATKNGEQ